MHYVEDMIRVEVSGGVGVNPKPAWPMERQGACITSTSRTLVLMVKDTAVDCACACWEYTQCEIVSSICIDVEALMIWQGKRERGRERERESADVTHAHTYTQTPVL
jgi:hypothetical protein